MQSGYHTIVKTLYATSPFVISGDEERACPPEDVGGYAQYLDALVDVDNDRHEELLCWRGKFDPWKFDAGKATKRMQRRLPD